MVTIIISVVIFYLGVLVGQHITPVKGHKPHRPAFMDGSNTHA